MMKSSSLSKCATVNELMKTIALHRVICFQNCLPSLKLGFIEGTEVKLEWKPLLSKAVYNKRIRQPIIVYYFLYNCRGGVRDKLGNNFCEFYEF